MMTTQKKTALFALLCALGAGAPAIAHALQQEPTSRSHAVHSGEAVRPSTDAEKQAGEGGDVGEDRPLPPINFFDFSNKEQPPYGVMLINFFILMGIYYWFGKKPVAEGLKARRASIAKEIEDAKKMRVEAEARAVKYQDKLKNLETELKDVRESLRAAGEAEHERIVRDAEEKATRLEKDAKFLVEQEMKQLRVELLRETIGLASAAAEELLKKRITPADQERLAEDYLAELVGKRAAGSGRSLAPAGSAE